MKKGLSILLLIGLFVSLFSNGALARDMLQSAPGKNDQNRKPNPPDQLTVNSIENPTGVHEPTFGWYVDDPDDDEVQTKYQIIVSSSLENIQQNTGDVWDRGEVESSKQSAIYYEGESLESNTRYYWKVRTWDAHGEKSEYSDVSYFDTGLLSNEDWKGAKWIKRDTDDPEDYTYARKNVNLPNKTIKRAMAYISATHTYHLYINEQLIGKGPTFAEPKYQYYNSYDVTDVLNEGEENNFSVLYHWYGGGQGRPASARGLIAKVIVEYSDGTTTEIVTDGTWKVKKAEQWKYVGQRNPGEGVGYIEKIDARDVPEGWNTVSFDDSDWESATEIGEHPVAPWTGNLLSDQTKIVETEVKPVSIHDMGNGKYVIDFGKVYAGVPQITFSGGEPGTTITMRSGYTLNEDGTVSTRTTQRTDMSYYYILDGNTTTFRPFHYLGFRYLQVDNAPNELTEENVTLIRRHAELDGSRSSFHSSNEMLNRVWELMKDSLYLGAQEGFVDTPTREKGQFLGDATVMPFMQVFGERVMSLKAINEFTRSQWDDGRMWAVYPTNDSLRDIPDYTLMYMNWVWDYYMQTGDIQFLERHYDGFKKIVDYINRHKDPETGLVFRLEGGSGAYRYGIVDWPATMRYGYDMNVDSRTVINGHAYRSFDVMSKIADELGHEEDEESFRAMADELARSMNKWLVNDRNVYTDGLYEDYTQSAHVSQHANIFPTALNIVPEEHVFSVLKEIKDQKMRVGMMNIKWLIKAVGEAELGEHLIDLYTNEDWNGWANIISKGATSTWESWDADEINESLSHPWGASGLYGMQEYILGVQALLPQHEKVQVKPLLFGDKLTHADGKVPTDRGDIHVGWEFDKQNGEYQLTVTIPDNMNAKVYVPKGNTPGTMVNVDGKDIGGTEEGDYIYVDDVGSGTHVFKRAVGSLSYESTLVGLNVGTTNLVVPEGEERHVKAQAYDQKLNEIEVPITWESADPSVATVDDDGLIKAVDLGETTITAVASHKGVTKTASLSVQVVKPKMAFYYDMGNGPVADGYVQILPTTLYREALGYGLKGSNFDQRDRGLSDPLKRDFIFSRSPYQFIQHLSNGTYDVRVIIGDGIAAQSGKMTIKAEDKVVLENIATGAAGEFVDETFTVTVDDGKLDLELWAEGSDTTARLNALEIVRVVKVADLQAQVQRFEASGEFADDDAVRALKLHLAAVSRFEAQGTTEKVLKHMKSFNLLLDHQKENTLMSEKAYHTLKDYSDLLIERLQ